MIKIKTIPKSKHISMIILMITNIKHPIKNKYHHFSHLKQIKSNKMKTKNIQKWKSK